MERGKACGKKKFPKAYHIQLNNQLDNFYVLNFFIKDMTSKNIILHATAQ